MKPPQFFIVTLSLLLLPVVRAIPVVTSATGSTSAAVQASVDTFRASLGTLNANVAGSFGSGRREINWDGVPDAFAAPNNLPANFFNVNSPRGVLLSTPGTGFQVSANASNPTGTPIQFGNIDPIYPTFFEPFSAQRLFTPLGSNITDVSFFIPGTNTPALTSGFGSIFSDVDLAGIASLQFFGASNNDLGTYLVPAIAGNETFSFLGVNFTDAIVSRVRITSGNAVLSAGNTAAGLVVMDDWIYGEPVAAAAVSTPDAGVSVLLLGLGLVALFVVRSRFFLKSPKGGLHF